MDCASSLESLLGIIANCQQLERQPLHPQRIVGNTGTAPDLFTLEKSSPARIELDHVPIYAKYLQCLFSRIMLTMFRQNNKTFFPRRSITALGIMQGTLPSEEVEDHSLHPLSVSGQALKELNLPAKY